MLVRGTTRIFGIFGDPVAHSLSPLMQNEALSRAGIDGIYVPFHVAPASLEQAVASLRALDIAGVNVTIPHKEAVCQYLDIVDSEARLIGAVNTIVNRDGVLCGYNTDGQGLLRSLAEDLEFTPRGKRVLLLGAGGACRAALVALARGGAAWIGIANRTAARAAALAEEFRTSLGGTPLASFSLAAEDLCALAEIDLLVNTSALGLKGESYPDLPWSSFNPGARVYDMVYTRSGTPLLHAARDRGYAAADGLGMLAGQGEESFALWTGTAPPSGVMKERLLAEFSGR
jgi:shikimate dehydrogenase